MPEEFCWPEGKSLRVKRWDECFENSESRKIKSTSYVPVPNKHDGKGFARIASNQRSCQVFTGWMLILQVASKCPERGLLVDEDGCLDVDDFAAMTRFDSSIFETAIPILCSPKIGWLEWVDTPDTLRTAGRTPDEIPVESDVSGLNPDTSQDIPTHPDVLGRTEQKGTEGNGTEIPPTPQGGDELILEDSSFQGMAVDPRLRMVIGSWFGRKESTTWSEKELRAFRKLKLKFDDDFELMRRFYGRSRPGSEEEDYRRRDVATLLNNWPGELDKARAWMAERSGSSQTSTDNAPKPPAWTARPLWRKAAGMTLDLEGEYSGEWSEFPRTRITEMLSFLKDLEGHES